VLGAAAAADAMLYGRPVLPAVGFVRFNLRQSTGASGYYGTHPVHWYVSTALPAILATHLPLLAFGVRAATASERLLLAAPALLLFLLSSRPHKELRFLLPILPVAFSFCGRGIASLPPYWRRRALAILAVTNAPTALFLSLVHQRAPVALMAILRAEAAGGVLHSVDVLTRCHQTPGHALLHAPHVSLCILECPPPALGFDRVALARQFPKARRSGCTNECDCFFAAPGPALRRRMQGPRLGPSDVVLFDDLLADTQVKHVLRRHGYVELARMPHTIGLDGWDGWRPRFRCTHLVLMRRVAKGRGDRWFGWSGRLPREPRRLASSL
jgi:phosphatidylinositol glycan class B